MGGGSMESFGGVSYDIVREVVEGFAVSYII